MATIRKRLQQPAERMTRAMITTTLNDAVVSYYAHKNFSCYRELGVLPWGKRRMDVFCINMKGQMIGVETKSCWQDFKTDDKWHDYLEHVNKFYFCVPESVYIAHESEFKAACRERSCGLFVLGRDGYLNNRISAKKHKMDKSNKLRLLLKVAWRGGESRRTHKRRRRLYIT